MALRERLRDALSRSSHQFLWNATAAGLAALLTFFVYVAYDSYAARIAGSTVAARNVATLIEQDIARNIALFDLSLQAVKDGISDPAVMAQEPRLRQLTLFNRAATAQGLGALVVLNKHGDIIFDSQSATPRAGNFADREYFKIHQNANYDLGLYISRPFHARLQARIWSLSFSRRINDESGAFAGIVSGTMRLSYFRDVFDKVALQPDDTITLYRDDGTLILNNAPNDSGIGSDQHDAPLFAQIDNRSQGTFDSSDADDGIARLYAFTRVQDAPLIVEVGLSKSRILQPWWMRIGVFAAIFLAMAASVLLLVSMLDRELRLRTKAERRATALARMDTLTGLANRRRYDESLAREWRHCARVEQPLSLLMIDVDFFKAFNDKYGHQEGDRVLAAISRAIAGEVKRPADLAARYGGEEFAILLPNTDAEGAVAVAERVRNSVIALDVPHDGSDHQVVTVSIGTATAWPDADSASDSLASAADRALYAAKDRGRNRVASSNVAISTFRAGA